MWPATPSLKQPARANAGPSQRLAHASVPSGTNYIDWRDRRPGRVAGEGLVCGVWTGVSEPRTSGVKAGERAAGRGWPCRPRAVCQDLRQAAARAVASWCGGRADGSRPAGQAAEAPVALRRHQDDGGGRGALAQRGCRLHGRGAIEARAGGPVPPDSAADGLRVGVGQARRLSHRGFCRRADPDRAWPRRPAARIPQRVPPPRRQSRGWLRHGAPLLVPLSCLDLRAQRQDPRHSRRGRLPRRARRAVLASTRCRCARSTGSCGCCHRPTATDAFDIDPWLGGLGPELAGYDFGSYHALRPARRSRRP